MPGRSLKSLVATRFLSRRDRPSVSLCSRQPLQRSLTFNKIRAKGNETQIYAGLRRLFKGEHNNSPGKHSSAGRLSPPASGNPRQIQVLASQEARGGKALWRRGPIGSVAVPGVPTVEPTSVAIRGSLEGGVEGREKGVLDTAGGVRKGFHSRLLVGCCLLPTAYCLLPTPPYPRGARDAGRPSRPSGGAGRRDRLCGRCR